LQLSSGPSEAKESCYCRYAISQLIN